MKLRRLIVSRLTRDLGAIVSNSRRGWSHRQSVEVVAETTSSAGIGEASPLPGYSPDDVETAERALRAVDPTSAPELVDTRAVFGWVARQVSSSLPSARFALETCLIDALARESGVPAWRLITPPTRPFRRVTTCALLPSVVEGTQDQAVLLAAADAISAGAAALKLKIGHPGKLNRELSLAVALRRRHPNVPLRLDANGTLTSRDIPLVRDVMEQVDVELIEEPVSVDQLRQLRLPAPIALDESLQPGRLDELAWSWVLSEEGPKVFVLKPATLGGWSRCLELVDSAARTRAHCVVSHAFGGAIELAACHHLAVACQATHDVAAGLFPHAGLLSSDRSFDASRLDESPGLGVEPSAMGAR